MVEEWVSITEAAERLTAAGDAVDRSTLSRYLKQHGEALPLRRSGKSNLVDLTALVAHRGENIRIRTAPVMAPAAAGRGGTQRRFTGSQADGAARKVMADAEYKELLLEERRARLTPVSEVDKAGRDSVALMQSAFDQAIETDAAMLALKNGWEERHVRLALKHFARHGLDVFHREVLERLEELRRVEKEEPEAAAPA